ncbi:hypothetical protein ACFYOV_06945 [Streptomyces sp. NPDC005931]|uniref:hypothetical protein n=1 Tax=Streptomyces sp. NPDC005931 TaxID=3364737 RepID=UPI0036CD9A71
MTDGHDARRDGREQGTARDADASRTADQGRSADGPSGAGDRNGTAPTGERTEPTPVDAPGPTPFDEPGPTPVDEPGSARVDESESAPTGTGERPASDDEPSERTSGGERRGTASADEPSKPTPGGERQQSPSGGKGDPSGGEGEQSASGDEPVEAAPAGEPSASASASASASGDDAAWLRGLLTSYGQEPKPHTQERKQSHAGNGTVNHGPEDQGPQGLDSDELDLRRMLHQAVQEVEPSDGTLDYLRRAVPARRARKRQALVGMAAAALLIGTAVPALVHVSTSTGPDANPSAIGHASEAQGGTSEGKGPTGTESGDAGGPSDKVEGTGKGNKKGDEDKGTGAGAGTGATEGADPSSSTAAETPACTAAQLGPAAASSAAPDAMGTVYGSFRVVNGSGGSCAVTAPGSVSVAPQGAADPAKVVATRHVAGDAAAGLPDPSLEAARLVLEAGEAYEVRFAWVPSETCPTSGGTTDGGTGGPSPDPTPTGDPTTTNGTSTGGETGMTTQLRTEDGTVDGSVTVTYTPETGSGAATTTISNACAGTVYWTGLHAAM